VFFRPVAWDVLAPMESLPLLMPMPGSLVSVPGDTSAEIASAAMDASSVPDWGSVSSWPPILPAMRRETTDVCLRIGTDRNHCTGDNPVIDHKLAKLLRSADPSLSDTFRPAVKRKPTQPQTPRPSFVVWFLRPDNFHPSNIEEGQCNE